METATITKKQTTQVISSPELLKHWQGHRLLTRKIIEAFPEKEFFEFSIGGMRPFAVMVKELLGIAIPGLTQIVGGETQPLSEKIEAAAKATLLEQWDQATEDIDELWPQITNERFGETVKLFGQYDGTVWSLIFYMIDNEIHHRGQGYVYLRSLGIEPHPFWDR